MLEDHSSRWSAAASPGGMIAGVLTILSLIVAVGSTLILLDAVQFEIGDTVASVILGVSAFLTLTFLYLLLSYIWIGYALDSSGMTISWGLWRVHVPYDEIEAVESAGDVLGEQDMGWQLFWPGYYVGTRKTDVGDIQVVATLPPRRQLLIVRTDGVMFAVSPERPLLFSEELIRWHRMFHRAKPDPAPEDDQDNDPLPRRRGQQPRSEPVNAPTSDAQPGVHPAAEQVQHQPVVQQYQAETPAFEPGQLPPAAAVAPEAPPPVREEHGRNQSNQPPASAFGYQQPAGPTGVPEPRPQPARQDAHPAPVEPPPAQGEQSIRQPKPSRTAPASGSSQPDPASNPVHVDEPVETVPDQVPAPPAPEPVAPPPPPPPGPVFGTTSPADHDPGKGSRFGAEVPAIAPAFGIPVHVELEPLPEPVIDPASEAPTAQYEVWFPDPPAESEQQGAFTPAEHEGSSADAESSIPFTPPKPVLAPAGRPRSEVLQPLTRVYRKEPNPTSPAIRPTLQQDSFSMTVAGVAFFSAVLMAGYITLQYDDIPPSLTLHWNVDGLPGRIGEPREIWILPVIAALVLLANLGLAWTIAQFDRFAARLLVSSTLVVHLVTWLALIMLLS